MTIHCSKCGNFRDDSEKVCPVCDFIEEIEKPRCPDHPEATVLNGRMPGKGRFWICLACGKNLGPAPPSEEDNGWESFVVSR